MRKWLIAGLLTLSVGGYATVCNELDYKQAIDDKCAAIEQAADDKKALLYKDLAILHYKDQEKEKAFLAYLKALEFSSRQSGATLEECQQYYATAAVAANQHKFPEFFERFFYAFSYLPEHYLAYKGKASLHAQLYALSRTHEERESHRQQILENAKMSLEQYPDDTSIYKMLIVFSNKEQRGNTVKECLAKICRLNIQVPRTDVEFYAQQAVATKQWESAKQFLLKCKAWYPNSRTVQEAQEIVDQLTGSK